MGSTRIKIAIMTKEQFDEFLLPLGLIWEHDGAFIGNSSQFDIGPGWYKITAQLITDLIDLGWNKILFKVKTKYGGGRFYLGDDIFYGGDNKPIPDRVKQWESDTYRTCDACGAIKEVSTEGTSRFATLCAFCKTVKEAPQLT